MRYLSVLADDLTGAADTAARCRHFGLQATIFLDIPEPPLPPGGALAFTSDSRHLPAAAAGRQARAAAASLRGLDAHWYKKIDSTLRGHIGSELDALLDLLDAPAAVVCPAFPAQERGLRNGYLWLPPTPDFRTLGGNQTAPPNPAMPAVHLPSLLRQQSRYPVVALSLDDVRSGEFAARMIQAARGTDARPARVVVVVDALTNADLDIVVKSHAEALPDALLCGSAGLAGAFARRASARGDFPTAPAARGLHAWQTVLLIVGSGSESAHRQIAHLRRSELPVNCMTVTPETAVAATASLDPAQPIWLLQQPPPLPGAVLEGVEARQRAEHLARIAAAVLAQRSPDLLILGGGDTAMRVLRRLGVARLPVERELLPGIPLCRAEIDGRRASVVIKPGSFGGDGTLVELLTGSRGPDAARGG